VFLFTWHDGRAAGCEIHGLALHIALLAAHAESSEADSHARDDTGEAHLIFSPSKFVEQILGRDHHMWLREQKIEELFGGTAPPGRGSRKNIGVEDDPHLWSRADVPHRLLNGRLNFGVRHSLSVCIGLRVRNDLLNAFGRADSHWLRGTGRRSIHHNVHPLMRLERRPKKLLNPLLARFRKVDDVAADDTAHSDSIPHRPESAHSDEFPIRPGCEGIPGSCKRSSADLHIPAAPCRASGGGAMC
jgi:hypothetical protein